MSKQNASSLLLNTNINDMIQLCVTLFEQTADKEALTKLQDLQHKEQDNILHIGFCGHFSAGKSSMINGLLEQEVLPSSPIPTSANMVEISHGESQAMIHLNNQTVLTLTADQLVNWRDYCTDGERVTKVEIKQPHPLLEDHVRILDTPGTDSTDHAHQQATEAALHLADLVFFVTDYNHVQSETNFLFLKSLQEKGKRLFLLINQVDKHREKEIPLATFYRRINEGLNDWGVQVEGIYFTSMKQSDHPLNQLHEVKTLFEQFKTNKEGLIKQHIFHALQVLLDEHQQFLEAGLSSQIEVILTQINDLKMRAEWENDDQLLNNHRRSLQNIKAWQTILEDEIERLLDNAIITPYTTTRLAEAVIEAYQPGFKMGLLFAKKKTEAEKQQRLEALYSELVEKIKAQIEWHFKELFLQKIAEYKLSEQLKEQVQAWAAEIPINWLTDKIKPGVNPKEYVYQYTKQLKQQTTTLFMSRAYILIEEGEQELRQQHEQRFSGSEQRLQIFLEIEAEEEKITALKERIKSKLAPYRSRLSSLAAQEDEPLLGAGAQEESQGPLFAYIQQDEAEEVDPSLSVKQRLTPMMMNTEALVQKASQLEKGAEVITRIDSFAGIAQSFQEQARRLRENQFTVCLFGAFSAGKSSFANALLGDRLLPVSPNPTTAAINEIVAADAEHPARTAHIFMKSLETMETEIDLSLQRVGLSNTGTIEQKLKQLDFVKGETVRPSHKPYISFLKATRLGWSEMKARLGTSFTAEDEHAWQGFIADEHQACFVERIRLYHDAELLSAGIQLIDTPGADSIYTRHTNVTFNYMKHADVILYLTYYNHAFSRADKQFLQQLAQVKAQLSLDKMFFIINAKDLASSDLELQQVIKHVKDHLKIEGIETPRLFDVSSLQALEGKQDSGMGAFYQSFSSFLQEELVGLLTEAADLQLHKGKALIEQFEKELTDESQTVESKLQHLQKQENTWLAQVQKIDGQVQHLQVEQETDEQLYYLKQRITWQFGSHYQEAFHPSILSGRVGARELIASLDELLFAIHQQMVDELKSTSFRLERYLYRQGNQLIKEWQKARESEGLLLQDALLDEKQVEMPKLPQAFEVTNRKELEKALQLFKNSKQFFEGAGKEALKEKLTQLLAEQINCELKQYKKLCVIHYQSLWQQLLEEIKQRLSQQVKSACHAKEAAIRGAITVEQISDIRVEYTKCVHERIDQWIG